MYLFLSGLISGYYDTLPRYHRVPQRLRRVNWRRRFLDRPRDFFWPPAGEVDSGKDDP